MTRINWDEVNQLNRLDEIIAYSIITLQEAYNAADNDDIDSISKNEVSDWISWDIKYDESGRAYFGYSALLYLVDANPLGSKGFLSLVKPPTRYLVNHASLEVAARNGDTSLEIDPLSDIPAECDNLERLLMWAVIVAHWWNQILNYLSKIEETQQPDIPTSTPLSDWQNIPAPYQFPGGEGESSSADSLFDNYNGETDDPYLPEDIAALLERSSDNGFGKVNQQIDLSPRDLGIYRENLVTCEEQDPSLINYSQQQLEALLGGK
jgi:hypothetical protein